MEGRQIVLNDGTVIPDGEAGYSEGFLWCWFTGYTIQQAASMFFDANKTSRIVFQYGDLADTYEGFTACVNLGVNADGRVSVCLTEGEDA